MSDVQQRVTDWYAAFHRRDIDTLVAAMTPDVRWPNGWEGGVVVGRDAVRDYWTRQWAEIDPTVEPTRVTVEEDGRVGVTVDQVVRDPAGVILFERTVTHVYRFAGDLVTDMEIRE